MNSEILRHRIAEAVHRHSDFRCQPSCPGPSVHDYDEADAVMASAGVDPFETKAGHEGIWEDPYAHQFIKITWMEASGDGEIDAEEMDVEVEEVVPQEVTKVIYVKKEDAA